MPSAVYFRAAASYLREHGWRQFSYGSDGRSRCAVGALRSSVAACAADLPPQKRKGISRRLHEFANRYLAAAQHTRWGELMSFNDTDKRKAAEVIRLFEAMADDLDLAAAVQRLTPNFLPEPSTAPGQPASTAGSSAPAPLDEPRTAPSTKGYDGEAQGNPEHDSALHIPPTLVRVGG